MTTRQMQKLRQKGWTYASIGRRAGMTRQGVQERLAHIPRPHIAEVWMAPRNWLFHHYRQNAHTRGYTWTLSLSDFTTMTQAVCSYCGEQPKQRLKGRRGDFVYNGIDRQDNSQGYRIGNVVACCGVCNRMKGILSEKEFKFQIQKIAAFSLDRQTRK